MNNIGIGIMCFFDEKYFIKTNFKIEKILLSNTHCYILTDKPSWFTAFHGFNDYLHFIDYQRVIKSYHDKLILHKHILENHQSSIVLDADVEILDESFIDVLKSYPFMNGISYIQTLESHRWNKKNIGQIDMSVDRWKSYKEYSSNLLSNIDELETIWEYLIVFNNKGINNKFYEIYEKLQIIKEYCDLQSNTVQIYGAGEGITTTIAAKVSNTKCEKDNVLYQLLKDKIKPILSSK